MAVSITKHQWLFDSSLRKTLYKNCTEKCCLFSNADKLRNTYDEIVNELLSEREQAIRIAQAYKEEY